MDADSAHQDPLASTVQGLRASRRRFIAGAAAASALIGTGVLLRRAPRSTRATGPMTAREAILDALLPPGRVLRAQSRSG